jgi:GNAT superfamily N-acetyltransferase
MPLPDPGSAVIAEAVAGDELALVRELFEEYAAWLGFSLAFQGFDAELAGLPGAYAPPAGRLLLARCDGAAAGCGGLRPLGGGACEMKRLYVRPAFRGRALGRLLAQRLVGEAAATGYARMLLDTIPARMAGADRLYRSLGFREIPAYYDNPVRGVRYMGLELG